MPGSMLALRQWSAQPGESCKAPNWTGLCQPHSPVGRLITHGPSGQSDTWQNRSNSCSENACTAPKAHPTPGKPSGPASSSTPCCAAS